MIVKQIVLTWIEISLSLCYIIFEMKTMRLIMLGFFIFIIVIAVIYNSLEYSQKKQGGKPLAKSPVIRTGCGCLILIIAIAFLISFFEGHI